MKTQLVIFTVLAALSCSAPQRPNDPEIPLKFTGLTIDQIDTLKFINISLSDYNKIVDYAILLKQDSINAENRLKGEVLLSAAAAAFKNEIQNELIDPEGAGAREIVKKFASHQYYVHRARPSDFDKLIDHLRRGDYAYIYSRLKVKWYFMPAIVVIALALIISAATLTGYLKFPYSTKYNVLVGTLLMLVVITGIVLRFY